MPPSAFHRSQDAAGARGGREWTLTGTARITSSTCQYSVPRDVRERLAEGLDTVLIPLGCVERHGNPHTPLGLDGIIVSGVPELGTPDGAADYLY